MSNRIDETLRNLRQANKTALSPYITAGDPNPDITVPLLHALVKAGADVLELGIPFSDPMAEGPVIQAAMERALVHRVNIDHVLSMVKQFRQQDDQTPIVLMGYLNPIEQCGYSDFASRARMAGVDGVIIVDLPPEEATDVVEIFKAHHLHLIFLCSPTTSDHRLQQMATMANGYLYCVSLKGVTGANKLDPQAVQNRLNRVRQFVDLPLFVGFGIKTAEDAKAVAALADGVVVGAGLIQQIAERLNTPETICEQVPTLIAAMRDAID